MFTGIDAIGFYQLLSGPEGAGRLRVFSVSKSPNPYKPSQSSGLTIHLDTKCVAFRLVPIGQGGEREPTGIGSEKSYRMSVSPKDTEVLQLGQFCQVEWRGSTIRGILDKIDRKYSNRVVLTIDSSKNVPITLDA